MQQSLDERIAFAIQVEMLRQKTTTSQVAAVIGEQYLWLHRRLKGNTPFQLEDVERIAVALEVPVTQLVEDAVRGDRPTSVAS